MSLSLVLEVVVSDDGVAVSTAVAIVTLVTVAVAVTVAVVALVDIVVVVLIAVVSVADLECRTTGPYLRVSQAAAPSAR